MKKLVRILRLVFPFSWLKQPRSGYNYLCHFGKRAKNQTREPGKFTLGKWPHEVHLFYIKGMRWEVEKKEKGKANVIMVSRLMFSLSRSRLTIFRGSTGVNAFSCLGSGDNPLKLSLFLLILQIPSSTLMAPIKLILLMVRREKKTYTPHHSLGSGEDE